MPVIAAFGGIWIVGVATRNRLKPRPTNAAVACAQERYGLKFGLSEALIFTNKSIDTAGSKIPTKIEMKEVPDDNPDEVVATVDDDVKPSEDFEEDKYLNANYDGLP